MNWRRKWGGEKRKKIEKLAFKAVNVREGKLKYYLVLKRERNPNFWLLPNLATVGFSKFSPMSRSGCIIYQHDNSKRSLPRTLSTPLLLSYTSCKIATLNVNNNASGHI